jgi:hypothetical protein
MFDFDGLLLCVRKPSWVAFNPLGRIAFDAQCVPFTIKALRAFRRIISGFSPEQLNRATT